MESFASQHTQSFAEFLRRAGVSMVVSTYQAGQLVLVRSHEHGANTHFISMQRPMGIAIDGGCRLTVGDGPCIEFFRNLPAVGRKIGDLPYDAAYLHRATHVTGDIDIHEMAYDRDARLWLINTRMSCLCTLSPDFSVVPEWTPPFITQYDLLDRCHLNGLGLRDGVPRYVSMLGGSDEPGGWRHNKTRGGRIMDITDNTILVDGLCMPHSPRWYRDQLWFLASGEGCLKRVEADGSISTVCELPGFTRGLDFFGRFAVIGLSQVRETAVFAGLPLTQRVSERQCGVYLVDIEEGRIVGFLHFVGDVREIFDLKLLPHRMPALVKAGSPLLANSYEMPEEALKRVAPPDPIQDQLAGASRLHAGGKLDEAIVAFRAILAARPEHRQARHQLGLALVDAKRWEEGRDMLRQVVELQPDNAEAWNGLALCQSGLHEHEAALETFDRAIAVDRQFALAHFNRALVLLKLGRYREGWPGYDWRQQTPSFTPFRSPHPQWRGEDISNKRLLVNSEQGNGDHIQFWRFLKAARARCRELIYVGPEKLAELAGQIEGVDESRVSGNIPRDRFDLYVPLMSLPERLGLGDAVAAQTHRYVIPPAHLNVRRLEGAHKVGFVWQGSLKHGDDRHRSVPLELMRALFQVEGIDAYSLQFPIDGSMLEPLRADGVANLEPELNDYSRSAAFVDQLDLVISVDTATAHLAGAMDRPLWILLAPDADWRWGLDGESTPWYRSARLIRRQVGEDWAAVIARVAGELTTWRAARG